MRPATHVPQSVRIPCCQRFAAKTLQTAGRARVQKPCVKPYARAQGFSDMGRYMLAPVSYEALDHASGFASEQCPEGFCAVARNTLRILTVERLGETFNQQARPNPLTPTLT